MSLNQLTANYTDSEGEQDDNMKDISLSSDEIPVAENKESARGTPASLESRESAANTPKKKVGRLVSYANEDDDDNDDTTFFKDDVEESDEILNSEPMDTGTEDGEEDKSNDGRDLGVKLPLAPTGKCSVQLQKPMKMNVQERVMVITLRIQGKKCKEIRERFERQFHKPGPTDKTIRELLNKFKRTGSVNDEPRSGRPRVSEHAVNAVRNAITEEPRMSIRATSRRLRLPNSTVHKILTSHLHKKSFKN